MVVTISWRLGPSVSPGARSWGARALGREDSPPKKTLGEKRVLQLPGPPGEEFGLAVEGEIDLQAGRARLPRPPDAVEHAYAQSGAGGEEPLRSLVAQGAVGLELLGSPSHQEHPGLARVQGQARLRHQLPVPFEVHGLLHRSGLPPFGQERRGQGHAGREDQEANDDAKEQGGSTGLAGGAHSSTEIRRAAPRVLAGAGFPHPIAAQRQGGARRTCRVAVPTTPATASGPFGRRSSSAGGGGANRRDGSPRISPDPSGTPPPSSPRSRGRGSAGRTRR